MMQRLPVKEHLRNAALYKPSGEPLYSSKWKRRLLNQYIMQGQLREALYAKNSILKLAVCIVIPVCCLLLVFTAYFGFLHPGQWFENLILKGPLNIPPIGLKEILIFAAMVNGLTFLIMQRKYFS